MSKVIWGLTISFLLAITCSADDKILDFSALEALVKDLKGVSNLPSGTAIAIIKDDQIIYEGYFGYADIEKREEVSAETAFYIGSITKPMFALSTLMLEEKGKLQENTTLSEMFPELDLSQIDANHITTKDLLGHTSGLNYDAYTLATAYTGLHNKEIRHKLIETIQRNQKQEPGQFAYTNGGYNVLSVWYDDLFNQPWQDTLSETVFKPLGLKKTSAYISDADKNGYSLAKTYSFARADRSKLHEPIYLRKQDNTMHAAGGVITTAPELAHFVIAQVNAGQVDGKQVFPSHVIAKSQEQVAVANDTYSIPGTIGYAWGWAIGTYENETLYSHGGGFAGVRAHVSFMPDKKLGIVILNAEDVASSELTTAIKDVAYNILLDNGDIEDDVRKRKQHLLGHIKNLDQLYQDHYAQLAAREMVLTLKKSKYTGTYSHSLMGAVNIKLNEQRDFEVSFGNMKAIATAYRTPDALRVELNPGRGEGLGFHIEDNQVVGLNVWGFDFKKGISAE